MRMQHKIRIEWWRNLNTKYEQRIETVEYLSSSKWDSNVGNHVFAVLPWDLQDGEVVIVYQNDEEVDGLTS